MTRCRILPTLTAAAALIALAHAPAASAFDYQVTKTADTNDLVCSPEDCSIREALDDANATDAVNDVINVPPGTYPLTLEDLSVRDFVTIDGDDVSPPHIVGPPNDRVFRVEFTAVGDVVTFQDLVIRGGTGSGSGGGVLSVGLGPMTLRRVAVQGNTTTSPVAPDQGGGGIYHQPTTLLTIEESTVSGNTATVSGASTSGGGGIFSMSGAVIENSTIHGNTLNVGGTTPAASGGGGYFTKNGGGRLTHVTITDSTSPLPGANIYNNGGAITLENSIIAGPTASCAGAFSSSGNNIESGNSCSLNAVGDLPFTDPRIDPLKNNGGPTPTRALAADSKAINGADPNFCLSNDQRGAVGLGRPIGSECDIGAFEFEGLMAAAIPDCSPSGEIPLNIAPVEGSGVRDIRYQIDGGPTQIIDVPDGPNPATRTLTFPEGRRMLTYWGRFSEGEAVTRPTEEVLVDQTKPTVAVENNQRFAVFVIKRRATIDVNANDALSGLTQDPSGAAQPLGTGTRGKQTAAPTATDLCGNQTAAPFDYTVLAPKLGVRTVVEALDSGVKVRAAGGARAAQKKGGGLVTLREPRELPVGAFVDTRRGEARITTSSNTGDGIQDGKFLGGLFQALQSRARRAKGLTTLRLKGSSFRRCAARGVGKRASASQRKRLGGGTIRKLRGNAKGRFRTRGRHSAATVRGTIWTVSDRCDGTLTKVKRGKVAVRDFRRKKTVVVKAGKRYLAKAG